MLRAALVHVRARLPRADARAPEHAKIERVLRGLFDWFCEHPEELPAPAPGADAGRPRDRLPRRHDRPLRDPRLDRALRCRRASRVLMARYTDDSRERVRDAVDFVELVGARTELRKRRRRGATGPVPVPRRAHAVVRDRPGREALPLLRLRRGRRRLQVRDGDRGARLRRRRWSRSPTATASSSSARPRTRATPSAASARERLLALLERTAAYYVRVLWESPRGGRRARVPGSRGLEEATLREFRVGYAPAAWDRVLVGSRRAGYHEDELLAAGLAQRGARRRGADRPLPRADHVPAGRRARARARLRRAGDAPTTSSRSTSTRPRARSSTRAGSVYGADLARAAAAQGRARWCSSRATRT